MMMSKAGFATIIKKRESFKILAFGGWILNFGAPKIIA